MAYTKTNWLSRQGTGLNKFTKSGETSTSVTLANTPDAVTQAGTPFSVENMNKIEQGIYDAHQIEGANFNTLTAALCADQAEGYGRDLLAVLGVSAIPQAMTELRRRCNNNGEIDSSGIPGFRGLMIGDYLDGLNLSGIAAPPGGTAPQAWNNIYKNNRIVLSGFNTYKGSGYPPNAKNHLLFIFRNCIAQGRMNSSNSAEGGYPASELREWLEGEGGDGSGTFATGLKAALGGDYLCTLSAIRSTGAGHVYPNLTVWPPSEIEVLGHVIFGQEMGHDNINVPIPIYQKSTVYRIKNYNGLSLGWFESSVLSNTYFCIISQAGTVSGDAASHVRGISPMFCVA